MGKEMIQIITSMNQTYHDLIGKDCVKSFLEFWPQTLSLTVYVEELVLEHHERIEQIPFKDLDEDYQKFQLDPNCNQSEKKFAKKAYSYMHALENSRADWLIWLDADVLTVTPLPESVLLALLDPQHLTVHMGVSYDTDKSGNPGSWYVPETGFYATNLKHREFETFKTLYCDRYLQRNRTGLRRYYDNDVFGVAIKSIPHATHRDLCIGLGKAYKTPLRHTVLGPYLNHHKAKHSKAEYSQDKDDQ